MIGFDVTLRFVRDFQILDAELSEGERRLLDEILAAIVAQPDRKGRFAAYYDPDHPSWLVRESPFMIHYAYDAAKHRVTFLNLFRRR